MLTSDALIQPRDRAPSREALRDVIEELANTPMTISSADWNRISNVLLAGADEVEALRTLVSAFETWVSGIYCDFHGLVRGDDDVLHDWNWIDEHRPPPGLPLQIEAVEAVEDDAKQPND